MGDNFVVTFIMFLMVLGGIYFLLRIVKGVFSLVIAIAVIMFMFKIGFVFTEEEKSMRLALKDYLMEQYQSGYERVVDEIEENAKEHMIINTKKVYTDIKETTESLYELTFEQIKERVQRLERNDD